MKKRYFKRTKSAPPLKKEKIEFKAKFPRIYRIFTDLRTWIWVTSFFLLVGVGFAASDLVLHLQQKQEREKQYQTIRQNIAHWEELASKYPDSRDIYFRLAVLEYQLGEKAKAKEYLQKSLELDPNFKEGRELEKTLNK